MYRLTCDGLPLLDWRDDDMVLVDPKVKLEVNKVGEGSFTIYKNHPHYGKIKKLKSVFEVSDDHGVIFRGRATGDTVDLDHGMAVDLEGAMAYFNDSVVRTFNFPKDFNVQGDRVAFFLRWLIDNHNSQVQDFQKLKLGNVTVKDENFARSTYKPHSTWDILRERLPGSSLGGYLCIRYEEDGNYIDYLSEFTETNSQEIVFGENLLDMKHETEASATYSAIMPIGALELTIGNLADGNITDDIVKTGDTLYSEKAVAEYGWIYAPTSETTWEELTDEAELLTTGVEWLTKGSVPMSAIEATAVDLHFTDEQVESLRIYKNVNVRSAPHDVAESFPLSKLEIELLNPQNTKVTVGKKIKTLTEKTALEQEKAQDKYSKLSKTDEEIRLEVQDEIKKLGASVDVSLDAISMEIQGIDNVCTELAVTLDGVTVTDKSGTTKIKGNSVETDTLHVKAANIDGTLTADQISLTGTITTMGTFSVGYNDKGFHEVGCLGPAYGQDASDAITYGVALTDGKTASVADGVITYSADGRYVIVTDKGVRLQAFNNNIAVTENNIYLSIRDDSDERVHWINVSNSGAFYDGDEIATKYDIAHVSGAMEMLNVEGVSAGWIGSGSGLTTDGDITYGVAMAASSTPIQTDGNNYLDFESAGRYILVTTEGIKLKSGDNTRITLTDNVISVRALNGTQFRYNNSEVVTIDRLRELGLIS